MSHRPHIQRKKPSSTEPSAPTHPDLASPSIESPVPASVPAVVPTGGQPLETATQEQMSTQFGHDFSRVRVHTDERAAASAQALDARAYTVGQDLVFGAGEYAPTTQSGQWLIAHELAHVTQQSTMPSPTTPLAKRLTISQPGDVLEQEADAAADQVVKGQPSTTSTTADSTPPPLPDDASELPGEDTGDAADLDELFATDATAAEAAGPLVQRFATGSSLPLIQRKANGQRPETLEDAIAQAEQNLSESDAEREEADLDLPQETVDLEAPDDAGAYGIDEGGAGGGDAAPSDTESAVPPSADAVPATTPPVAAAAPPAPAQAATPNGQTAAPIKPEALITMPKTPPIAVPAAPPAATPETPATEGTASAPTQAADAPATAAPAEVAGAAPDMGATDTVGDDSATPAPAWQQSRMLPPGADDPAAAFGGAPAGAAPAREEPAPAASAQTMESAPAASAPPTAPAPAAPQQDQPAAVPEALSTGNASGGGGGGGGAAAAPMTTGGGGGGTAPKSPEEDPGFQAVVGRSEGAAVHEQAHDPAANEAAESQAAADPQGSDVTMAAQDRQIDEIQQQPVGEFDADAFKKKLMAKIAESAPSNLKEADEFKENNKLGAIKDEVSGQVKEEKQQAEAQVEEKTEAAPDESGIAPKEVQPLPPSDAGPPPPAVGAADATPKPRGDEEVGKPLQENSKALDQQMSEANVTEEQLQKSNEPSFNQALDAKKEAQQDAAERPQEFRQQEQATLTQAQGDAEMTAEQKAEATRQERVQLLEQVFGIQGESKTSDEAERREVSEKIADIYQKTKDNVEQILTDLDGWVTNEFDQKAEAAKQHFESIVNEKMTKYKWDRYLSDPLGPMRWLQDQFMGLPPEVNAFYEEGKTAYIADMDAALTGIANHVAAELTRAKDRVTQGRQEIQEYVAKLPASLQQVGQEAAEQIQTKFDELEQSVVDKQDELIDSLAQKYNEKMEEVNARIEEMKLENSGLINKAKLAIEGVINTILELKAMLEGMLARAAGAVELILKDPIKFLGNLIDGVKLGLQNFVSNIGTHLQSGLLSWLTGAVGAAGLRMPAQLDLPGIFDLVLQVLGLTYENIRTQLVKALGKQGEAIVGALETTWEILQIIRSEGLAGLWEYVQGMVGDLYAMVIEQIKEMIASEVIQAGIQWLIGILGGPAGAFIKAAQAIIKVVMWFIENGSRLMSLVNAIIDSVSAIANGALDQAAGYIEDSLAQALPLAISFLADLLGLGGIAKRVSGIIEKARAPVNKAIAWLVKQVKAMAKKIGKMLGFGQEGEEEEDQEKDQRWNAGIAAVQSLPEQSNNEINSSLRKIKSQYGFNTLKANGQGGQWQVTAIMRKEDTVSVPKEEDTSSTEITEREKIIIEKYQQKFPNTTLIEEDILKKIRSEETVNPNTGRFNKPKVKHSDSDTERGYFSKHKGGVFQKKINRILSKEEGTRSLDTDEYFINNFPGIDNISNRNEKMMYGNAKGYSSLSQLNKTIDLDKDIKNATVGLLQKGENGKSRLAYLKEQGLIPKGVNEANLAKHIRKNFKYQVTEDVYQEALKDPKRNKQLLRMLENTNISNEELNRDTRKSLPKAKQQWQGQKRNK